MTNIIFKKSIAISLLGHLTVFGLFGVSFGRHLPVTAYDAIIFQGSVLNNFDLSLPLVNSISRFKHGKLGIKTDVGNASDTMLISRVTPEEFSGKGYVKPAVFMAAALEKQLFMKKAIPPFNSKVRAVVMLYPRLPHSFSIYFKDRQIVHMELMFMVSVGSQSHSVSIKRKISSGNLEADLLCMRYISHYLFLRQNMFSPDTWQNVKIELSASEPSVND